MEVCGKNRKEGTLSLTLSKLWKRKMFLRHGLPDNEFDGFEHRSSHCADGSPYRRTGYHLKPFTKKELKRILDAALKRKERKSGTDRSFFNARWWRPEGFVG